jgi:hypothetical protein
MRVMRAVRHAKAQFQNSRALSGGLEGGFYFRPKDEALSVRARLMKKLLGNCRPGDSNRGITVALVALVLSVPTIGFSPFALAAPVCSLKAKAPANARTFAKTSEQSDWQEYESLEAVPELSLASGMTAQFWRHKHGTPSVTIVEPGQDFQIDTRYCFDEGGQLESLSFEIRTALGWGHRVEGTVMGGVFNESSSEFFRLKDGKTTAQPDFVGSAPPALRPRLYLSMGELPFARFLESPVALNRRLK